MNSEIHFRLKDLTSQQYKISKDQEHYYFNSPHPSIVSLHVSYVTNCCFVPAWIRLKAFTWLSWLLFQTNLADLLLFCCMRSLRTLSSIYYVYHSYLLAAGLSLLHKYARWVHLLDYPCPALSHPIQQLANYHHLQPVSATTNSITPSSPQNNPWHLTYTLDWTNC